MRAEPAAARIHRAARPSTAEDETALLLEAMRALRRQGDPARARVLLTRYLQQHPTGALAEEALAMSIEAAVAAHDADAPALARRYLRSYPGGPFRAVATQALSQPRFADRRLIAVGLGGVGGGVDGHVEER